MSSEKPWLIAVTTRVGEHQEAKEQALSQIDYRGLTWHATKEEAETEANRVLDQVVVVAPTLRWLAVWAMPWIERMSYHEEAGRCYSTTRESGEGG